MGVVQTRHSQETVDQVIALWNDGLSASRIAAKLGLVSRSAVISLVHRKGGNTRSEPHRRKATTTPKLFEPKVVAPLDEPAALGPIGDFPKSGCRYIHGDTRTDAWQMCAHERVCKSSYCAFHRALLIAPPGPLKK
jgi:GcrA cell cycle regulator